MFLKSPPVFGLLITLLIGLVLGAVLTYNIMDKNQLEAQSTVRAQDNDQAEEIAEQTQAHQEDTQLIEIVTEHSTGALLSCVELTNEQIESMCTTHYMPSDILRAFRFEVERARGRLN